MYCLDKLLQFHVKLPVVPHFSNMFSFFLEKKIYLINQQRKVYKYLQKAEHKDIRNITMKRRKKKEIMTTIS